MSIIEKLQLIREITGYTQERLARELAVSFVTMNSWLNGKSQPHPKAQKRIDELYLKLTGQKIIPKDILQGKIQLLKIKSKQYGSILNALSKRTDLYNEFLLLLTYHSNKIEGSTLAENETSAILFQNSTIPNKNVIEHLEVKNHQAAFGYLINYLSDRKNYLKVPDLISSLEKELNLENQNNDIVKTIAYVHATFEKIHPFSDGNGRIGRLLIHAMSLRNNLPPAVIRQENRQFYYTYLAKAQTEEDTSLLEDFLCDAFIDGFRVMEG